MKTVRESEITMFESHPDMTIRRLYSDDEEALRELAGRDSAGVPEGALIGAIAPGGALLAAISLETHELVADPFLPSEHAVALLRVRARQLGGDEHEGHRRRFNGRRRRSRAALPASPPGAGGRLLTLSGLRPPG